jgi:hypothetical protein
MSGTGSALECAERAGAAPPGIKTTTSSVLSFLHEAGGAWRPGNLARLGTARAHAAARSRAAHAAVADNRPCAGVAADLTSGVERGLAAAFGLRHADHGGERDIPLHSRRSSGIALGALECARIALAIALIVFPHTYRYARNLLVKAYSRPHIITARAKGLGEARILFWHVVPVVTPQLLAVAGVSVSMAVGAAIPVEALCGFAGIGQLAWQAALARDLPLLVNITILVTLVTLLANSGADVIGHVVRGQDA